MNKDKYGKIINGTKTYLEIADALNAGTSVIIGWTDERYTHLDLLFNYKAKREEGNYLQRGLRGNELYVSIIGLGAFGFDVTDRVIHKGYISEKLNIRGEPTISKLAELINGIIKELIYNDSRYI